MLCCRYYETVELEDLQEKCITYNMAKVINESPTLKKLVDLGVELYKWEEKIGKVRPGQKDAENLNWTDIGLRLDFDTHVAPKVRLLADYVPAGA